MELTADLFWSYRSPYSYLGIKRYRQLTREYNLKINLRPVQPLAIREPEFFDKINKNWISYLLKDCLRTAEFNDLPFTFPSPDPVNMDMATRAIAKDQPLIHWITRLGIEASKTGDGMAFADEMSSMIWGGTKDWTSIENMSEACGKSGFELSKMESAINGNEAAYDQQISDNQDALEKAGHWGVPTLVFEHEPFFGQDRITMAIWRMEQKGLIRR